MPALIVMLSMAFNDSRWALTSISPTIEVQTAVGSPLVWEILLTKDNLQLIIYQIYANL